MLTPTDLDVLDLSPERAATPAGFASVGIFDLDLWRKAASDVWARIHARPRAPAR